MTIDAVLPAAGRIKDDFAAEVGTELKALIQIGSRTVLQRTIDTLRATGRVGRIVVVGPEEVGAHPAAQSADAVLPEGGDSGPDNIISGLEWLREANGGRDPDRVLVVTTDLPFLTPECICGYLDACPEGADICAPLVDQQTFQGRFPKSQTMYVKLRDGRWTMGCAFLVDPRAVFANRDLIERCFQARKSQLGMAQLLGIGFILRFLAGQLTVADIEERCRGILGCSACAVRESAPELAFDIDHVEDYRYAVEAARSDSPPCEGGAGGGPVFR